MSDDDNYEGYKRPIRTRDSVSGTTSAAGPTISRAGPTMSRAGVPMSRLGTSGVSADNRPMTSNIAAGYRKSLDAFQAVLGAEAAPPLEKPVKNTPEQQCLEMEKKISNLMEESAILAAKGDYSAALEKAKLAYSRERALAKLREQRGLGDQINLDLTYCVQFNLAVQFQNSGQYPDAIKTYNNIVNCKQYAMAGRLKVNMGNIYYSLKKYPAALKMYKQALDAISVAAREVRIKVMRNIGNALVQMGQYHEAIGSYEAIFETARDDITGQESRDIKSAFNLLVCYYAVGNKDKMKQAFTRLLEVRFFPPPGRSVDKEDFDEDDPEFQIVDDPNLDLVGRPPLSKLGRDPLQKYLKEKAEEQNNLVLTAARLVGPIVEAEWTLGYDMVIESLRHFEREALGTSRLAAELEMVKAIEYLRRNNFRRAIESLKEFERKDLGLRSHAAINLSFLYFLERDIEQGLPYAELATKAKKFSAKAWVNYGNFKFLQGEYEAARDAYAKAHEYEADCLEAIYNLGLVHKQMGNPVEALTYFEKLNRIIPDSVEVLFQIASCHEMRGNTDKARYLFEALKTRVPTDPALLSHLGSLYFSSAGDEQNAVDYYIEAYRHLPVDLEVIKWLGAYFIRSEIYEKALAFFERGAQIEPTNEKWQLLVANCYRRLLQYPQAKALYEEIHRRNPNNIECLQSLVRICEDLGLKEEALEWQKKLKELQSRQKASATAAKAGSGQDEDEDEEEPAIDPAEVAALLGKTPDAAGGDAGTGGGGVLLGGLPIQPPAGGAKKKSAAERRAERRLAETRQMEDEEADIDLDEMLPDS